MVRITLLPRRNRNTMAFTARLFMLLAIAVPILARTEELPEEFPEGHEQGSHVHAILQRIRDSCPPFGHPDNRFNVTVLGTISPEIGGCASMRPTNHDLVPSFNLWLGSPKTGGGNCDEKNMDHYTFECMAKHPFFTEEDTLDGWYVLLYDRTARWSGREDYRCALYETVNEDPPIIQMVISGNQSCKGLSKRMEQSEHAVPNGFRRIADGSIALLFTRDLPPTPMWRKKRSEEQGRGCRFPDWSQGSWTDLKVDESLIRYEPAFHDKDDVDYVQENDDGKYGGPENTGAEQYIQRSQRHAPVGISGIDHSIFHDSRSHRGRRSIPYINTAKMFRARTSTDQNNTLDQDSIVQKLFNDTMHIFDSFNYRLEESSAFSDQPKPLSNTNMQEPVKSSSRFDYKDTATTSPQNYPKDLDKNSFKWNIILDQLRKIKYLGNPHNDSKKETNNEKKRCFCYTDFEVFIPKNNKDKMELFNKVNKYSSTQKYPENLKEKSNYPFDVFERKKRELGDQEDHDTEGIKHRKKKCVWSDATTTTTTERYRDLHFEYPYRGEPRDPSYKPEVHFGTTQDPTYPRKRRSISKHLQKISYHDRDFEAYTPGDMDIPKILDEKYTFSTKKKTTDLNKKLYPFDYVQRKKRDVKHLLNYGEEEMYNAKKKCYCYSDNEGYDTFIKNVIYDLVHHLLNTNKYHEELKDKSNNLLNIFETRKKRELGDQEDHDTEGIKHRKKKCVWSDATTTTTTERHRDLHFEYPYRGEPRDPSYKPEVHFGTTQDPTYPRKRRSISVDEVIKDDEKEALKKIKITDFLHKRIRLWNIMRAIEYIKNNPVRQSNGDTRYNEYDNTRVTDLVRYLKYAGAHGVPYKQALLNWRNMERTYRQRIAEILYSAFPGQTHPDIIMRDFDQTYDGIEYDFDPMHPEGTADDPIAYQALTLPGGYQQEPRLSRRTTFEQKRSESATAFGPIHFVNMDDRTDQGNTQNLNQRRRRSSAQQNQQQHATTTFTWRCEMAVDNDVKQLPQFENGAKFLTYGGRVVENNEMTGNDQQNEQDSKMTYGCLWLVPRGPNILEFSMLGTGMPSKNQSMQTFARQLCNENSEHGKDTGVRNEKKLRLRQPSWVTETRNDDKKRVPVRCPVPPGIVFYGVVPAPPPPSTVSTNKDQITPLRLCAKLVSSADDCTAGQMGPADQMKYTVSECVDQDSSTDTSQTEVAQQTIFEEREYQCIGQWTEPQEHFSPVAGEKPVMLTYTYLKRLSPVSKEGAQYECFVGTPIPNDEGLNPETTTTILLTEAGTDTKCSRLSDPYRSGMKLVGTKIKKEGACKGSAQPVQDTTGGSWYSLKPQSISPSIPGAANGGGAWYAAPPVPVIAAQGPTTMTPILTGRHTGGNGATFTSRHNEQNRRPQSANLPPKTNHSFRTVADKRIVILAVLLFTARRFFN